MNGKTKDNYSAFTVFAFVFAFAQLFDHSGSVGSFFSNLTKLGNISKVLSVLLIASAVWVLLKPSSVYRSIFLYVVLLLRTIDILPRSPNHVVFQALVLITILTCFVYLKLNEKNLLTKRKFYEIFAPVVRIEIVLLYFWAAFHKINTGFFDTYISCATLQLFNIKDTVPLLPTPGWFIAINPYFTLLTESLIPILLIIPRTRIFGLLVAFFFHFILGFKYTGFTILVYAFLCLFIPNISFEKMKSSFLWMTSGITNIISQIKDFNVIKQNRYMRYLFQILFLLIIIFAAGIFMKENPKNNFFLSTKGLYVYVCIVFFISFLYFIVIKIREIELGSRINIIPDKKWLLIFPIIIFLNGMLPHFGVKNVQSMAMFSNLRTEGGQSNHLIIPYSFQISDNLSDLVTIKGANVRVLNQFSGYSFRSPIAGTSVIVPKSYGRYMNKNNIEYRKRFEFQMPYFLLQSLVSRLKREGVKDIKLEYERGGKVYSTRNAELDPELSNKSIITIKLLNQRAVPDDNRGLCMW